jgi:hypothetical protein
MVAVAALTFAFGIALAQFYKALVLVPATMVVVVGALLLELAAGHSPVHTLLSSLLAASALQVGFLSGLLFSGLVIGASRNAPTTAPRPK